MEKQFKYHPLVEGLKVNEDGTEVIWNGKPIRQTPINEAKNFIMKIKGKNVSRLKIVCETWNGLADTPELIASKIDETKDSHYTNLKWSKRGQGVSHTRAESFTSNGGRKPLLDEKDYQKIITGKPEGLSMKKHIKNLGISETAFYNAQKRYGK